MYEKMGNLFPLPRLSGLPVWPTNLQTPRLPTRVESAASIAWWKAERRELDATARQKRNGEVLDVIKDAVLEVVPRVSIGDIPNWPGTNAISYHVFYRLLELGMLK